MLSSIFPCLRPLKEHWSTFVWLAWLQDGVSFQIHSCSPSHIPPTLSCTFTTIILIFVMHAHMQTQAKKHNTCAPTNANESRSVNAPNLKQPSRLYLYKQSFAGAMQPHAFQCLFFPVVLNNSCLIPVDLSLLVSLYSPLSSSHSFCHPCFSPSCCPLLLPWSFLSFCLPFDASHYQRW